MLTSAVNRCAAVRRRLAAPAAPHDRHLRHQRRPGRLSGDDDRVHHHRLALLPLRRRPAQGQEQVGVRETGADAGMPRLGWLRREAVEAWFMVIELTGCTVYGNRITFLPPIEEPFL